MKVDADTKIDPPPLKDEILKLPSRDKFREDMDKLDLKAEECKVKIDDGRAKRKQVFMGGKIGGQN